MQDWKLSSLLNGLTGLLIQGQTTAETKLLMFAAAVKVCVH